MLPARNEYVLNTSEYEDVRARLGELSQITKPAGSKSDVPVLRKAPSASVDPGEPVDAGAGDRPTLKRH